MFEQFFKSCKVAVICVKNIHDVMKGFSLTKRNDVSARVLQFISSGVRAEASGRC